MNNGDQVGGWDIVFPAGITMVEESNQPTLTLQEVDDVSTVGIQDITFVQATYNASQTITFATQTFTNDTGARLNALGIRSPSACRVTPPPRRLRSRSA